MIGGGLSVASLVSDGKIRRHVLELYGAAARDWEHAGAVLSRGFRRARTLHSRERRFVGEAVYGMIRARRRLVSVCDSCGDDQPLAIYLAWLGEQLPPSAEWRGACDAAGVTIALERLAGAPLGVRASLPDFVVEILVDAVGEQAEQLAAAFNARAPLTISARIVCAPTAKNWSRGLRAERVTATPTQLGATLPDAFDLDGHVNAQGVPAFADGWFEVQDAASQAVAARVAPPARGLVIDACAGAGGKTLALGAQLGNQGRIWALDITFAKLVELQARARRAGLTNVQTHVVPEVDRGPLDKNLQALVGRADCVLVDAPCSGLGALRRHPETRWRLSAGEQAALPTLQRKILERYAPLCRPGGRVVYATCTFARNENDAVVDGFLADHPEFKAVAASTLLGVERAAAWGDGERLRLFPHVHGTDGFFAAALQRTV